jgi:hypothetical protein
MAVVAASAAVRGEDWPDAMRYAMKAKMKVILGSNPAVMR